MGRNQSSHKNYTWSQGEWNVRQISTECRLPMNWAMPSLYCSHPATPILIQLHSSPFFVAIFQIMQLLFFNNHLPASVVLSTFHYSSWLFTPINQLLSLTYIHLHLAASCPPPPHFSFLSPCYFLSTLSVQMQGVNPKRRQSISFHRCCLARWVPAADLYF